METMFEKVVRSYRSICVGTYTLIEKHGNLVMLGFGSVLIAGGLTELSVAELESFSKAAYDDGLVSEAVANLFCLIEGSFGALIMVVAGLGAIVAAAMGAYRAAVGMLVVAVGAFILRSLVSLFFGTEFDGRGGMCSAPGATPGGKIPK